MVSNLCQKSGQKCNFIEIWPIFTSLKVIAFSDENDESFTKSLCFSAESSRRLGVADIIGISKATCRKDLP